MSAYLLEDWRRDSPRWVTPRQQSALRPGVRGGPGWPWWMRDCPDGMDGVWAISEDWVRRRLDPESALHGRRDDIVDWCARAESLAEAVNRACLSRRPDGRLHNHQSRVPTSVRIEYGVRVLNEMALWESTGTGDWTWDELWAVCLDVGYKLPGVGPVFMYDVATRVGAYLQLCPSGVYLKAGTLEGTRLLAAVHRGRNAAGMYGAPRPGMWYGIDWYQRWGMKAIARYGKKYCPLGPADALEDALCTLRTPLQVLALRSNGRLVG